MIPLVKYVGSDVVDLVALLTSDAYHVPSGQLLDLYVKFESENDRFIRHANVSSMMFMYCSSQLQGSCRCWPSWPEAVYFGCASDAVCTLIRIQPKMNAKLACLSVHGRVIIGLLPWGQRIGYP